MTEVMGSRLVVGQQVLALPAGVRIPAPQSFTKEGIAANGVPSFVEVGKGRLLCRRKAIPEREILAS